MNLSKKTYCIFGISGFVAPRHVQAIKSIGGILIGAMDPHSSCGFIDNYFRDCEFFTKEEEFKSFCLINKPDYMVVCSPNDLHKQHSMLGLTIGSNVICEKPVVLCPSDILELQDMELSTHKKVYSILQLRLNPVLQGLRCKIQQSNKYHKILVNYITPRGKWYAKTWKGDEEKSGGLVYNIGVHLFDFLEWCFGSVKNIKINTKTPTEIDGNLYLEKAHVSFHLSIDGLNPKRSLLIDNREIEFSGGFTNAHVESYRMIEKGKGFGLIDTLPSIVLCDQIRKIQI